MGDQPQPGPQRVIHEKSTGGAVLDFLLVAAPFVGVAVCAPYLIAQLDPNHKMKQENAKTAKLFGAQMKKMGRKPIPPCNMYEQQIMREVVFPDQMDVSFSDIGGLQAIKDSLQETVIEPLLNARLYRQLGGQSNLLSAPKGVLFYGPPGTGKTMMAKAIARDSNAIFINVSAATLQNKFFGETQKMVRAVFSLARKLAPSIIFVDEIDVVLRKRGADDHEASATMKGEFMTCWDGLITDDSAPICVFGATNRPFDLDEAIMRRLPRSFIFDLPDVKERESILTLILRGCPKEKDVTESWLASKTEDYSGNDLKEMCRLAATSTLKRINPSREKGRRISTSAKLSPLTRADFESALRAVRPTGRASYEYQEAWMRQQEIKQNGSLISRTLNSSTPPTSQTLKSRGLGGVGNRTPVVPRSPRGLTSRSPLPPVPLYSSSNPLIPPYSPRNLVSPRHHSFRQESSMTTDDEMDISGGQNNGKKRNSVSRRSVGSRTENRRTSVTTPRVLQSLGIGGGLAGEIGSGELSPFSPRNYTDIELKKELEMIFTKLREDEVQLSVDESHPFTVDEIHILKHILFPRNIKETWQDIGGLDDLKQTLEETVTLPLQEPDLFHEIFQQQFFPRRSISAATSPASSRSTSRSGSRSRSRSRALSQNGLRGLINGTGEDESEKEEEEEEEEKKSTAGISTNSSGVVLIGPSGVGKTTVARALAKSSKLPFIAVSQTMLKSDFSLSVENQSTRTTSMSPYPKDQKKKDSSDEMEEDDSGSDMEVETQALGKQREKPDGQRTGLSTRRNSDLSTYSEGFRSMKNQLVAEQRLKALFSVAKKIAPAIIFIDDMDQLFPAGETTNTQTDPLAKLFISLWEEIGSSSNVMVVATSNDIRHAAPSLYRQFSQRIPLKFPDTATRKAILELYLSNPTVTSTSKGKTITLKLKLAEDVNSDKLAELTKNYSATELKHLCQTAFAMPRREALRQSYFPTSSKSPKHSTTTNGNNKNTTEKKLLRNVCQSDFINAMKVTGPTHSILSNFISPPTSSSSSSLLPHHHSTISTSPYLFPFTNHRSVFSTSPLTDSNMNNSNNLFSPSISQNGNSKLSTS